MTPAPSGERWERMSGQWWYLHENGQLTWAWNERDGYWYPFNAANQSWGAARYGTPGYPRVEVTKAVPSSQEESR